MTNFSWRQAVFTMIAVFVTGAAAGGFATSLFMAKTVNASRPPQTPQEWRQQYVGKLQKRLSLSDGQVGQLNGILDDTKQRMDAVKARYKPEMDQIQLDQVKSVHAILKPEQSAEYNRYREERDRERKKQQEEQNQRASTGK